MGYKPKKKRVLKNKAEGNPWFTAEVYAAQKGNDKLYRKKLKNPTPENIDNYRESLKSFKKLVRTSKQEYNKRLFEDSKNSIKQTWKNINNILKKTKTKDKLPSTFEEDGKTFESKEEIADG